MERSPQLLFDLGAGAAAGGRAGGGAAAASADNLAHGRLVCGRSARRMALSERAVCTVGKNVL